MLCGMFTRRDEPWVSSLDDYIEQLVAMGIPEHLRYQRIPLEALVKWTPNKAGQDVVALTMEQLLIAFLALPVLWGLASLVFIIELF